MHKEYITCPITGLEKEVLKFDELGNHSFIFSHPITGQLHKIEYDEDSNCYLFPAGLFEHRPLVSVRDAMEILGVSKMRVSALCSKNYVKSVKVGKSVLIDAESLGRYNKERKAGS